MCGVRRKTNEHILKYFQSLESHKSIAHARYGMHSMKKKKYQLNETIFFNQIFNI